MDAKNEVLAFLKDLPKKKEEQFNIALGLFRKSKAANDRQLRHFNNQGFSEARLNSLLYELRKAHSVTDKEIMLFVPVQTKQVDPLQPADEIKVNDSEILSGTNQDPAPDAGAPDEQLNNNGLEIIAGGTPAIDPDAATPAVNIFEAASDEVKADIKLREEFPFLKAPDCPNEFKILVADKLTAYEAFVEAHKSLLVSVPEEGKEPVQLTDDEIFNLAKAAVVNFEVNQAIYDELNHYKNTGEILGVHPIFEKMKLEESVNKMIPAELAKRKGNLVNYINRENKKLESEKDPEKIVRINEKIAAFKAEKELVDARLNADDKK